MDDLKYELEAILFDLDGTLVDTAELILASYRHTFSTHLDYCPPDKAIIEGFGTPMPSQLARFVDGDLAPLVKTYQRFIFANHDALIKPISGVSETLRSLRSRGYVLAVVTSKTRAAALMSLQRFDLAGFFQVIVTEEDTVQHKPHPEPLLLALDRLQIAPTHALYVGDSAHDLVAGKAAGVRVAAALWGPCTSHDLLSYQPDYALNSICDLLHFCLPLDSPRGKIDNASK